jgi:hypothetical protein
MLAVAWSGCSSSRKSISEKRGLMIQENTQLGRNKALYSKHNVRTKKDAYRKYKKNRKYK